MHRRVSLLTLAGLLLAVPLTAQTTYNPTRIQFDSPDHTTNVSSYVVEYWLSTVDPATGSPFSTSTLAKADVTTTGQASPQYEALLAKLTPLPAIVVGQTYKATLRVRGIDPEQVSARSGASNFFGLAPVPATPAAVSIR